MMKPGDETPFSSLFIHKVIKFRLKSDDPTRVLVTFILRTHVSTSKMITTERIGVGV